MDKKAFSNLILNSLDSPFNIHILNIVNNVSKIHSHKRISETLDLFSIQNIFNKNIYSFLKNINLSESVFESDSFLSITNSLETIFSNILLSEKLHNNLRIIINNIKNVLDGIKEYSNSKELEKHFETLEDSLSFIEEKAIIESINNLVDDEEYAFLLWNSLINFFTSLYGVLASVNENTKWSNIIVDKNKFEEFIRELSNLNK